MMFGDPLYVGIAVFALMLIGVLLTIMEFRNLK